MFTTDPLNVQTAKIEPYEIRLTDPEPYATICYKLSIPERKAIREIIKRMLDAAILRRSTSNYASPAFLKLKKDGNHRFLCNFAKLNEKIEQDRNSVPRIENIFQAMEGANYFSKLDANQGFFQIPLAKWLKILPRTCIRM